MTDDSSKDLVQGETSRILCIPTVEPGPSQPQGSMVAAVNEVGTLSVLFEVAPPSSI